MLRNAIFAALFLFVSASLAPAQPLAPLPAQPAGAPWPIPDWASAPLPSAAGFVARVNATFRPALAAPISALTLATTEASANASKERTRRGLVVGMKAAFVRTRACDDSATAFA